VLRDYRYKSLVIRDIGRLLAHVYCNYGLRAKKKPHIGGIALFVDQYVSKHSKKTVKQ